MSIKSFLILFIALALNTTAQEKTSNPEFSIMLDTLLTHSVNEVFSKNITLNKDIVYLDSREKKEFNTSHIKGAKWVGFNTFNLKKVKKISKDQKIIVYCTVGYRSEKIAEKLIKAGFTDVSNLYGGIFEWVHNHKSVVNKKGIVTKEVHTYDKVWGQWLNKGIKKY